ncbi:MAG: hypothetical protein ACRCYY_05055 [Trueperaceae bacterium]
MATTVRITINDDLGRVLETLKGDYPTLDYSELFKLGLSELYHKSGQAARERWLEQLPSLELTKKESEELKKTLADANTQHRLGKAKPRSVKSIMDAALAD